MNTQHAWSVTIGSVLLSALVAQNAFAGATGQVVMLPFAPMKPVDASTCPVPTKLSAKGTVGSTKKTTFQTVGTLFFNQAGGGNPSLFTSAYTLANLVVMCRGDGQIRLVKSNCTIEVVTITCKPGGRPWTAESAAFSPGTSASFDLQVKADSGILEWAHPALLVY